MTPTAIALGNFDGVHRGHARVLAPVADGRAIAQLRQRDPDGPPVRPTAVTFHPHPQAFFSGRPRLALTPPEEKARVLQTLGLDQLVLIPFDRALADLEPDAFVRDILGAQLQARFVAVGEDFRFGRARAGTAADLKAIAASCNIPVEIVPLYREGGNRISSSAIRNHLEQGAIAEANHLLGRPYELLGRVARGQQLGRTLGFPTANLALPPDKFLPRCGVYAVRAILESGAAVPGVMNLGRRPTVNGQGLTAEAHLLDWSGDLYDRDLTVELMAFLRPERAFASLDDLKARIRADCDAARDCLAAARP